MLSKIAWRNIWRSKTRSAVIIASVAVGLWAGFFLLSFYNGLIHQRIQLVVEGELSHLQLHNSGFLKDYDPNSFIASAVPILERIQKDMRVKQSTARLVLKGMIATAAGSSGVKINGVMKDNEDQLTHLSGKLVKGKYFSAGIIPEILVSEVIMKKLKLTASGKAIITFQDAQGNLASGAFRVRGVYRTASKPYDELNVFVRVNDLTTLAGIEGEFNEVAVLLKDEKQVVSYQRDLQKQYPTLEIKSWTELSPEMNLLVSVSNQTMMIYMGIILMALGFGIVNTMLMAVVERTREIGMLMALGMNRSRVFGMILLETIFLTLAGIPPGVTLGLATITYTHQRGINLSRFSEAYSSLGYATQVYPVMEVRQMLIMLGLVVIMAIGASVFPARRALKLKPAIAIRL